MEKELKRCATCNEFKPSSFDFFHKRRDSKDGLKSSCKKCLNKKQRQFRELNLEKTKEWSRNFKARNKEKISEYQRKWRSENKEWLDNYSKVNRERINKNARENRKKIPPEKKKKILESNSKRSAAWRKNNPDYMPKYHKKYREVKKEKISAIRRNYKARKKNACGNHNGDDIINIIKKQNNKCFWCDCDLSKIHIDHYIPLKKGGSNDASNLVASCPKCNQSKGAKMPWVFNQAKAQELFPDKKVIHATADALLIALYGTKQQ